MKVRVEFNTHDGDYDLESTFDTCEFSTVPAETAHEWGQAVRDFADTAGSRFDRQAILCEALIVEGGHYVDWRKFVGYLADESKQKLIEAITAAQQ